MCKQAPLKSVPLNKLKSYRRKTFQNVCICYGPPCEPPCHPTPLRVKQKKKIPPTKPCKCPCLNIKTGPPCKLPCPSIERFPPLPYESSKQIHFLPSEVVVHNKPPNDCWVSIYDRILDISTLLKEYWGRHQARVLAAYAGKDISHFFDQRTHDIKRRIHPVTGVRVAYAPHGPIPHTWPDMPTGNWAPVPDIPWWFDPNLEVGLLTKNPRPLRVINMWLATTVYLTVCEEDKISRIMERYLQYNSNAMRYIWKVRGKPLDMNKTLTENSIPDDREAFNDVFMRENFYVPSVQIYFKDAK